MQVNEGLTAPPPEVWEGSAGAPDYLVLALRQADAGMRAALAALRFARSEGRHASGLPAERLAGLAVDMTGSDVRFLSHAIEVLDAMPATWDHFQDGLLSWSQLRGIILAARPLRVADREWLDDQLAGAVLQGGEPDRIVDIADDLAARIREQARPDRDVAELDRNQMVLQPTLDGRRVTGWFDLDADGGAVVAEATDRAADPPTADDTPVDADGRPVPASWGPCRRRSTQRAEGLVRLATSYLGRTDADGTPTQARPSCLVILPADLTDTDPVDADPVESDPADADADADANANANANADADSAAAAAANANADADPADAAANSAAAADAAADADAEAAAGAEAAGGGDQPVRRVRPVRNRMSDRRRQMPISPRLLWRLPGGRGRITTTTAARLACDATSVLIAVDGDLTPTATSDATTPITLRQRRAAAAADQGCRFPGCTAPVQWTDLYHIIPREHGGPTILCNLVSLCRRCHTRVHQRGWTLILHPDRTLTVTHGRWSATSRPPLHPPPSAPSSPSGRSSTAPPPTAPAPDLPETPPGRASPHPGRASPHPSLFDRAFPDRPPDDRASTRPRHHAAVGPLLLPLRF